jgi:dihydroflavonol-4-reductase
VDTVLVTGGSGFIARRCIAQLLDNGYSVRTTLRDLSVALKVRAAVSEGAVATEESLEFAQADLNNDHGWPEAMKGCRFVIHSASPMGAGRADDMIRTASDGTRRVLGAALDAGVERIVVTSAANTASPLSYRTPGVTDETLWTDPQWPGIDSYRQSKTFMERAAWDYVAQRGADSRLTTILPGAVFGPVLGRDRGGSVEVIGRLLRGEMPMVPKILLEVVDVRDVAWAHIAAMTIPAAGGQRLLATGEMISMPSIAKHLRDELGNAANNVPKRAMPDVALRLLARRKPELQAILPGLGRRNTHTVAKAQAILGWERRPAKVAVLDCARSLIEHSLV